MPEEFFQHALMYRPPPCEPAVAIKRLASLCEVTDHRVDKHIAGTRIKGPHRPKRTGCGKVGEVADAPDVDHSARTAGIGKEQVMQVGRERGPLSTYRHVPHSEVGHGLDARPLGNDRRRSELKSRADLSKSRLAPGDREMMNGLPMRPNEAHVT